MNKSGNRLWTRDFTILSIGGLISMCGNTISGFAFGLLILDYTKSTTLYAVFMAAFTLPMIVVPFFVGPILENKKKCKVISLLDFVSAVLYVLMALLLWQNHFSFLLILGCLILGSIDSIYRVAYDSVFPMLVTEGNYQKAYSISSTFETISALMIPVSAVLYNMLGIVPLFLINAASFFVAAVAESQIRYKEKYLEQDAQSQDACLKEHYLVNLKEGMNYLKLEKGLLAIAVYFIFNSFSIGAAGVIELPYFKANYNEGEFTYMYVWGFALIGKIIGGMMQYHTKIPKEKKFVLSVFIYLMISVIGGVYLYMPLRVMMAMCFIRGLSGVISFNIRASSVQSYVPDPQKSRFNGIFRFLEKSGVFVGQLAAGAAVNWADSRFVLLAFMGITFISALAIMLSNKARVAAIYNRI